METMRPGFVGEPLGTMRPIGREADAARRIESLRRLTRLLDEAIRVPGTNLRIGLDALIGLIPGAGDVITTALAAYIVLAAARLGVSKPLLLRMVANLGVDFLLGAVPLAGDIFDALWKANRKNLDLLERHLAKRGR